MAFSCWHLCSPCTRSPQMASRGHGVVEAHHLCRWASMLGDISGLMGLTTIRSSQATVLQGRRRSRLMSQAPRQLGPSTWPGGSATELPPCIPVRHPPSAVLASAWRHVTPARSGSCNEQDTSAAGGGCTCPPSSSSAPSAGAPGSPTSRQRGPSSRCSASSAAAPRPRQRSHTGLSGAGASPVTWGPSHAISL